MPRTDQSEAPLSPELDAVATAAAERLHVQAGEDPANLDEHDRRVRETASAAIQAGAPLRAIADAERTGEDRARRELTTEMLRKVERAGKRKRDSDSEYEQAVARAARLGLSHREIAQAARVTHGTVRAILTRTDATANGNPAAIAAASDGYDGHDVSP